MKYTQTGPRVLIRSKQSWVCLYERSALLIKPRFPFLLASNGVNIHWEHGELGNIQANFQLVFQFDRSWNDQDNHVAYICVLSSSKGDTTLVWSSIFRSFVVHVYCPQSYWIVRKVSIVTTHSQGLVEWTFRIINRLNKVCYLPKIFSH